MRALQDGRLDDAERLAADALAFGQQMDHPNVRPVHAAQILHLWSLRGRFTDAAARLARYVEQYPQRHSLRAELARMWLYEGEHDAARRALEAASAAKFEDVPRDSIWLVCLAYWAEVASRLGHRRAARILYERLAPHANRVLGVGPSIVSLGHGTRYLGLLAAALGRHAEAAELLAVAEREHQRMGARPWLVLTLCDEARVLAGRGRSGAASDRCDELLERARAIAREVGMQWPARDAGRSGS